MEVIDDFEKISGFEGEKTWFLALGPIFGGLLIIGGGKKGDF